VVGFRPTDWHVLDLEKDPTPGDPDRVKSLARQLHEFADDVQDALRLVKGMADEDAVLSMVGKTADVFRDEFSGVPKNLKKLKKSYDLAGDALAAYWPKLERAQALADKALVKGREAQADLASAKSRLSTADSWVTRATKEADKYKDDPGSAGKDVPKPDESKVRAATRDATHAKSAQTSAQSDVTAAQSALDAAKKMAADARKMREDAAREAKNKLEEASDAGIQNRAWYEEVGDWVSDNWDTIVAVCKVVVAVVGIIAMIIGGPILGAIVLIAALVVLADTLNKYAKGQASLWDVGLAALDCIPGMKGLTTLGGLAKGAKAVAKTGLKGAALAAKGLGKGARASARQMAKLFCKNDPIDVATGEMVMSDRDIFLPGILPLVVTRHYRTGSRSGRWFGPSWTSTLDQRLLLDDYGVRFAADDGMILHYPVPEPGAPVMPVEGPRWPLHWSGTAGEPMVVEQPEIGQKLHFAPVQGAPGAELLITSVTDRNSHSITFRYDDGSPVEILHSGGYRIGITVREGHVSQLTLLSDPEQAVLMRYGYDQHGNLSEIYNFSGQPLTLSYDDQRRITGWTDRVGTRFSYTYDPQGRCIRTLGSDGYFASTFTYLEEPRQTVYTDSLGYRTTFDLDEAYHVVRETDALGAVTLREWDRFDRLISTTDPIGRTTTYRYDASGNTQTIELPDGAVLSAEYNDMGQPVTITEPDGARWRHTYDAQGRLTAKENPVGAVTRFDYDDRGARRKVIDPTGAIRRIATDDTGLPTVITDPLGGVTTYTRDSFGNVVTITDPLGGQTRLAWRPDGRLISQTLPDGSTERWQHDAEGNLLVYTNAAGYATRYEPGPFSLPMALTQPDGSRLTYAYDTELRLTRVTNPQGLTWTYEYDAVGRVVRDQDFNGRTVTYRYDLAGQPLERVNGAGQSIRSQFNARGDLIRRSTDEDETQYTYDAAGRLLTATNTDATITYRRDAMGAVLSETCNGRSLELSYDLLGRRTHRRPPGGPATVWEYDADSRLTALQTAGHAIQLHYDTAGRETERHLADAAILAQSWDSSHRLTEQLLTRSTHAATGPAQTIRRRTYGYRPDGVVTAIDDTLIGPRSFDLDEAGRPTTATSRIERENYSYDSGGNLLTAHLSAGLPSEENTNRSYDGLRIRRNGRTTYEHDQQGRIVRASRRLLSGGTRSWHYTWDALDQLTDVITPDGRHWHYVYDPHGRRIAKQLLTDDGTVTEHTDFVWEGTRLAEQTHHRVGAQPSTTTWHWRPGEHTPLAQTQRVGPTPHDDQESVDTAFYSIVTDLIGTPTELIDEEGRVAWSHRTTVWGVPVQPSEDAAYCPLRFPGQYYDDETGLAYNVRRYYDSDNARYLSPDPLGLDPAPNNYAYVSNPFSLSDPLGLAACTDLGGWYSRLQPARSGNEINHIPAKKAYKHLDLSPSSGPSIRMDYADHRAVTSTGSGRPAKAWHQAQKDLIDQGRFDEAMKMDIDDIRARFGTKYDQHIADMVASMPDNRSLQRLLDDNGWTINYDLLK
jgi:RHS repeat-associated protein